MPKITEEARTARRDQIIAAAAGCFARTGYHATTMADIAEAAGVAKGTPYLYFPGKEALFIALHVEWDCGLATRVDAAVSALAGPARQSPRSILSAVASAIAVHVTTNSQTCRVLMEATMLAAYEPAIAARVQAGNTANLEQLTGLFQAGVAAGEWPAGTSPALRARLFTAGLYGLMSQWPLAPARSPWRMRCTRWPNGWGPPIPAHRPDRAVARRQRHTAADPVLPPGRAVRYGPGGSAGQARRA